MKNMRQLINLMEGVIAVPGLSGEETQGTEHEHPLREKSKPDLINPEEVSRMASMPHESAKSRAIEIIDSTNTSDIKKEYLKRQVEQSRNTMAVVKLLYDMILKGEGHGVRGSSYSKKFDEESAEPSTVDNDMRFNEATGEEVADVVAAYRSGEISYDDLMDYLTSVPSSGPSQDSELDDYTDQSMRAGEMGMEEAFAEDIQNGYNDTHCADGDDYFPNGADGPVVKAVGPSGARHGDNPEQKKMQVAETHKELVYAYRKFLSESKK